MNSVLVYVDLSQSALQTASYAAQIAHSKKFKLVIVQNTSAPPSGKHVMIEIKDLVQKLAQRSFEQIQDHIAKEFPDLLMDFYQIKGSLDKVIPQVYIQQPTELVVLDQHHLQASENSNFSSDIERLLQKINCPLLLVSGDMKHLLPANPSYLDLDDSAELPAFYDLQRKLWGKSFKNTLVETEKGLFRLIPELEKTGDKLKSNGSKSSSKYSENIKESIEKLIAHKTDLLIVRIPKINTSDYWKNLMDLALHDNHIPCMALPYSMLSK